MGDPGTQLKGRVLVADPDPSGRRDAVSLLEQIGLTVDAVASGAEALKGVQSGAYDALLIRIEARGREGDDAVRAIRDSEGRDRHIPIIGVVDSGVSERPDGLDTAIEKPLRMGSLESVLGSWLQPVIQGEIPLVHVPALEQLQDLGKDEFQSLIQTFAMDVPKRVDRLREAIAERNVEESALLAHGIRGAALMVGALRLADAAGKIETRSRAGDFASLKRVFSDTSVLVEESIQQLKQIAGID